MGAEVTVIAVVAAATGCAIGVMAGRGSSEQRIYPASVYLLAGAVTVGILLIGVLTKSPAIIAGGSACTGLALVMYLERPRIR